MKFFNVTVLSLPILSLAGASSTMNIRGNKSQEVQDTFEGDNLYQNDSNNRLLQSGGAPCDDSDSDYSGPRFDFSHYESDDFELITDRNGEYGSCMDRDGHYFDYMWYDWESMDKWMSSSDYDYYSPRMCEEWCYSSRDYYRYFHQYDESRMHDYEYYYKYFIGFEVYEDGCGCIYDYGFGRWMESFGIDTHSWPDGHAPIYTTDGGYDESSDQYYDIRCYGYNKYHAWNWSSEDDS